MLTYVGGTAAPGTYTGVVVTATDADGAVLHGTFNLTVDANAVSNYGNEVNRFGNGFDSFRQHQFAGAIIAGWTATQGDPATHFLLSNGTHQGAFRFEYAPKGTGSGLCVSDPGGGWSSDPLRDGLILTSCNTGPWQQFIPQSNGSLQQRRYRPVRQPQRHRRAAARRRLAHDVGWLVLPLYELLQPACVRN